MVPRWAQEHEQREDKLDDTGFETLATPVIIIRYHSAGSWLTLSFELECAPSSVLDCAAKVALFFGRE